MKSLKIKKTILLKKTLLFLMIVSLFLSEIVLSVNEIIGFSMYSAIIIGILITLSKSKSIDDYSKLGIFLIILPIIRLTSLFLQFEIFWNTLIIYNLLLFLVTFYTIKFKIDIGYTKKRLSLLVLIIPLGVVLGFIGNMFFNSGGNYWMLFLLPLAAYSEEVLFRGLIQKHIKKIYGGLNSVIFTALLFCIFSLGLSLNVIFLLFAVGLILGVIYYFTENIFLTITLNMILNLFIFVLPKIM